MAVTRADQVCARRSMARAPIGPACGRDGCAAVWLAGHARPATARDRESGRRHEDLADDLVSGRRAASAAVLVGCFHFFRKHCGSRRNRNRNRNRNRIHFQFNQSEFSFLVLVFVLVFVFFFCHTSHRFNNQRGVVGSVCNIDPQLCKQPPQNLMIAWWWW